MIKINKKNIYRKISNAYGQILYKRKHVWKASGYLRLEILMMPRVGQGIGKQVYLYDLGMG